jgi:hypothetical protein
LSVVSNLGAKPCFLAHQPDGRALVAPTLNQHIKHLTLMIDGAPQVHVLAGDPHDHLVEMPSIARPRAAAPQVTRDHGTEFQHPAPHCFVGHVEPALGQEVLNVAVAQGEPEVYPNRVLDDRRREAMSAIREMHHAELYPSRRSPRTLFP